MANQIEAERTRRRYERATGPFDGLLEGRVLIYDLNVGGCYVNSPLEPAEGTTLILKIQLPEEGWIDVNAEALYRLQHGFAVQFLDLDDDTASRIARTVATWKNRRR